MKSIFLSLLPFLIYQSATASCYIKADSKAEQSQNILSYVFDHYSENIDGVRVHKAKLQVTLNDSIVSTTDLSCDRAYRPLKCVNKNGHTVIGDYPDINENDNYYNKMELTFDKGFELDHDKEPITLNAFSVKPKLEYYTSDCKPNVIKRAEYTAPRLWNEMILFSIRNDLARPTVTARNLFHLSIAMWDAYAAFDESLKPYMVDVSLQSESIESDRAEAISYAAYTLLSHRYKNAPGNRRGTIQRALDFELMRRGYNPKYSTGIKVNNAADVGLSIAEGIINDTMNDGSLESDNYEDKENIYVLKNPKSLDISKPGTELIDINYWQRLYLPEAVDQSGNPRNWNIQPPLTLYWGKLDTFGQLKKYQSVTHPDLYFNPKDELPTYENDKELFVSENIKVITISNALDPMFGPGKELIDASPNSQGNNELGTNQDKGYSVNPITDKAYEKQMVSKADFYRSLAEFWADGPSSETPPGHWNVIANDVMDSPDFKWKWEGQGQNISKTLYQLKLYLTLNGALHDSAIVAWGIKGHFQSARPISVARHLAKLAETDPEIESLVLKQSPQFKKITKDLVQKGQPLYHLKDSVGKIAVQSWLGPKSRSDFYEIRRHCQRAAESRTSKRFVENLEKNACKHAEERISGCGWMLLENWLPYQRITFVTPPFPGFISGHSTFSRAAAEVLAGITGSPFFPGGLGQFKAPELHFENGPSKEFSFQWATYFDASDQSGQSRIYGGIHASYDDLPARKIGSKIGLEALKRQKEFFAH